MHLHRWR